MASETLALLVSSLLDMSGMLDVGKPHRRCLPQAMMLWSDIQKEQDGPIDGPIGSYFLWELPY